MEAPVGMQRFKYIIVSSAVALALTAANLSAQQGPSRPGGTSGGGGGGGTVQTLTIASGVTTNTTTSAVAGVSGNKTFWGEVICSAGACAQTQAIYGDQDNDAANGLLLCTLTLTDTARDQDACAGVTANYPYYYVVTTGTSGTSATGAVYANY